MLYLLTFNPKGTRKTVWVAVFSSSILALESVHKSHGKENCTDSDGGWQSETPQGTYKIEEINYYTAPATIH